MLKNKETHLKPIAHIFFYFYDYFSSISKKLKLKNKFIPSLAFATMLMLAACGGNDDTPTGVPNPLPPADLSAIDNGNRVMMQAFYWDTTPKMEWWNILSEKLADWKDNGVNRIWLPPASKGLSGNNSMGYDVSDYFDLGNFNQFGTTKTRFGSKDELTALIQNAHSLNIEVIADIVINHNSGGGSEFNPFRDRNTFTRFDSQNGNASGKFNRNYNHFHPNNDATSDPAVFEAFPDQDLSHAVPYVQEWLWESEESVAKYYKNEIGFDGWRFDFVKGFEPWVIQSWMNEVGGFAVGEFFDGNAENLRNWVDVSGIPAFDFGCFFKLEESLDRFQDLSLLNSNGMLRDTHPEMAVTFAQNHDTRREISEDIHISDANKMIAYAYILTHDGYPTIFYSDYEDVRFKSEIQRLLQINRSLAAGEITVLAAGKDEYIMKRVGQGTSPGLIFYINISESTKSLNVATQWKDRQLHDYSTNSSKTLLTDAVGKATIECPPNSYTIWSVK